MSPVEVSPGVSRATGHGRAEVARGFEKPSLFKVAAAHGEPGPERGHVARDRVLESCLRSEYVPTLQERRPQQCEVVNARRFRCGGSRSIVRGLLSITEGGVKPGPVDEKSRRDRAGDVLGQVELRNRTNQRPPAIMLAGLLSQTPDISVL